MVDIFHSLFFTHQCRGCVTVSEESHWMWWGPECVQLYECQKKSFQQAPFIQIVGDVITSVVFMFSFLKLQPGEKASRFQNALSGFCRFLRTVFKMQTPSRWEPLLGWHLLPAKLQSCMKNTNIVSELDLSPGQMNSNADRKVNRVQTLVGTVAVRVENHVKPCVLHQCSAVIRSAGPGWDMDMDLCRCVSGRLAPASCVYAPRNLIIMHRNQRLVLVYR